MKEQRRPHSLVAYRRSERRRGRVGWLGAFWQPHKHFPETHTASRNIITLSFRPGVHPLSNRPAQAATTKVTDRKRYRDVYKCSSRRHQKCVSWLGLCSSNFFNYNNMSEDTRARPAFPRDATTVTEQQICAHTSQRDTRHILIEIRMFVGC